MKKDPRITEIAKHLKVKSKELKVLAKEMKSKRKKRSGAVIHDDMTHIVNEMTLLRDEVSKIFNDAAQS